MAEYTYKGKEDKYYYDVTGRRIFLTNGCVFSAKVKPEIDGVEEYKPKGKVTKEDKNDSSK